MLMQNRKGLSTTTGAAIVIILLAIAAGAYYYLTLPTGGVSTTSTSNTTTGPLPGKGMSIGVVFDVGGLGDRGFNDLAHAGMLRANQTFGVDYFFEVALSATDFPALYSAILAHHPTLVVGVGFDQDTIINQTAQANPNTKFALIDGDVFNQPNVISVKYQEHIGSAVIAGLAVALTKTNTIGFLGAVPFSIIYKFWNGWKAGAVWASNYLNKNVTLLQEYAGPTFDYFNKPTAGQQVTQHMLSEHADVVFMVAGGTGIGGFNAIGAYDQQQGWNWSLTTPPPAFAIGVDANQDYYGTYQYFVQHKNQTTYTGYTAPSFVITSETKKVDLGVFDMMKAVVYGNYSTIWSHPSIYAPTLANGQTVDCGSSFSDPCHITGGAFLLGLAQVGVGPTQFAFSSQYLTPTAKRVMAVMTEGILNGSIVIPEDYNPSGN